MLYVVCLSIYLQDHWKCLFLGWYLEVASESPPSSSSSSSSFSPPAYAYLPRPYIYREYSVISSLRFLASQTNSSCSWIVGWILKEKVLEQVLGCKNGKGIRQEWGKTHRSCTFRKMVAYDICVAAHHTLTIKTAKTIDIDRPGEMRRVNRSTSNRAILTWVSPVNIIMWSNTKEEGKWMKRENTYRRSKGRHESGIVELLIV